VTASVASSTNCDGRDGCDPECFDQPATALDLEIDGREVLPFPWARLDPAPSESDRIADARVDPELANEAVTFHLQSGVEGTLHQEQVLEYHRDPDYLRQLVLHRLTVAALRRRERSSLGARELARRMRTSPAQLYRLLDPTNTRKTVDAMIRLLQALDAEVEVRVL
jgi:hypothetical protein